MTKKKFSKADSKMVKNVTDIVQAKGYKSDLKSMQAILFPLMAVKKQLDIRQEHKESFIHETLDKVNSSKRNVLSLTREETQEILNQNEDLLVRSINSKERELYVTSGRLWIQLGEEVDGLNAILDVTPIANMFKMNICPIPIE